MNVVYAALGVAGFVGVVAVAFWFVSRTAQKSGAAQQEVKQAEKERDNARVAGAIVAEHRDTDDTVGRLRDHRF